MKSAVRCIFMLCSMISCGVANAGLILDFGEQPFDAGGNYAFTVQGTNTATETLTLTGFNLPFAFAPGVTSITIGNGAAVIADSGSAMSQSPANPFYDVLVNFNDTDPSTAFEIGAGQSVELFTASFTTDGSFTSGNLATFVTSGIGLNFGQVNTTPASTYLNLASGSSSTFSVAAVPEPSSALVLLGASGMLLRRRSRR